MRRAVASLLIAELITLSACRMLPRWCYELPTSFARNRLR